eukprot:CAMPEP_0184361332 /NCGR_PEP_ID=MMETSP1089-20130417/129610_1 /TAXON_ID=38269 ORGANISM="Gloeochaete wittrockiana, Strain SAG46.84" /NCGR_SAMPLE_ID=MMETSP1089 /ASSEMBLY_ACC=CAM_ASM_000445 /LENGTH=67 /DNA_ID=CAMNT_0026700937 /DNA_START=148 /DNA_END=351 /DNA_ORIENTATION=+
MTSTSGTTSTAPFPQHADGMDQRREGPERKVNNIAVRPIRHCGQDKRSESSTGIVVEAELRSSQEKG